MEVEGKKGKEKRKKEKKKSFRKLKERKERKKKRKSFRKSVIKEDYLKLRSDRVKGPRIRVGRRKEVNRLFWMNEDKWARH